MPKEVFGRSMQHDSDGPYSRLILKWGQLDGQLGVEFDNFFSFHSDLDKEEVPEYNSLWFNFESRDDFNKMIRVLRRMRDTIYGRDE